MKYTIEGFSQNKLIEFNLDNTDALILRWFVDFMPRMLNIDNDGKRYQWVKYQAVIEDLPCIGISNRQVIARRFNKFVECGIMESFIAKNGGIFTCFRLTNQYMILVDSQLKSQGVNLKVDRVLTQKLIGVDLKVDGGIDSKVETKYSSININNSTNYSINNINENAEKIINYFNNKMKLKIQGSKEILLHIDLILKEYTIDDFYAVIDYITNDSWHLENKQATLSAICRPTKFYEKLERARMPNVNKKQTTQEQLLDLSKKVYKPNAF